VAASEREGERIAHECWPNAALPSPLSQELPQPAHFESAVESITPDRVAESIVCGSDLERHLEALQQFIDAGFEDVYVHQVGPDQEVFFQFYEQELLPRFAAEPAGRTRGA
jgi:hypothetical protein